MGIPVGELLKEWQSYVTTISRNLMELSEQTDVKIIKLKAKGAADGYSGLTREKAVKACDGLDTLWRYYSLLSGAVDKANDLYSRNSFLRNTEDEARDILERVPVTLEKERIDISSRNLLTPESREIKVNLHELLKIMQESFEKIRITFNEISHASETLETRLEIIKGEIGRLKDTASRIGIKDMSTFDIAITSKVQSDPLSGLKELDALYRNVEMYKTSIKSVEREYNETISLLNRSAGMINEIQEIAEKSKKAVLESERLFGTINKRPVIGREVIDSLRDWLSVLESKLSEGSLNAAKIGSQRLEKECALKLETERDNYNINSRDYNEWLDLKGEFKALMAKYEGLRARGVSFDSSIDGLKDNLQKALYADSIRLDSCRQMIEVLRSSLRS